MRLFASFPTTPKQATRPASSPILPEVYGAHLHEYWEEAYILEGRIYDETLQRWLKKGSFCCRPPWMKHGPYKADPEAGCEEICYWRYPRKAEKSSKILPMTMRKSSGLPAVIPRSQVEQAALETRTTVEQPQEIKQSIESGDGSATSPLSPKRQLRLAAYLVKGDKQLKVEKEDAKHRDVSQQKPQTVEHPKGANMHSPLSLSQQSRLAAYLASEETQPRIGEEATKPMEEARENTKSIGRSKGDPNISSPTSKRQSRLAAYLTSEEKLPKAEGNDADTQSQPQRMSPPGASSALTPPRQSRLAAYRSGWWNS